MKNSEIIEKLHRGSIVKIANHPDKQFKLVEFHKLYIEFEAKEANKIINCKIPRNKLSQYIIMED